MPRLDGPFDDTFKVCHTSGEGGKLRLDPAKQDDNQPLLLITPTYERAEQVGVQLSTVRGYVKSITQPLMPHLNRFRRRS